MSLHLLTLSFFDHVSYFFTPLGVFFFNSMLDIVCRRTTESKVSNIIPRKKACSFFCQVAYLWLIGIWCLLQFYQDSIHPCLQMFIRKELGLLIQECLRSKYWFSRTLHLKAIFHHFGMLREFSKLSYPAPRFRHLNTSLFTFLSCLAFSNHQLTCDEGGSCLKVSSQGDNEII